MRADLAPFAVDVALALAGLGVLFAVGLVPRRAAAMVAALGLAYLVGASVVPLVLIALLTVGVPFGLETFVVVVLVCVGAGAFRWRSSARPEPRSVRDAWRQSWRSWSVDIWVVGAFIVAFGGFAVAGLVSALSMPLTEWDAWSIWARKAAMLTGHDTLVAEFWTNPSYSWIHLDYPIQIPVWEALHSRAAGEFHTQALLRHFWVLLVAFVWAAAYLVHGRVRPVVWAPLLLLAAAAPGVWQQALTGYADIPMAIFACIGAIALAIWLREGRDSTLALAAIVLAAAANTKNEGLLVAAALLAVAGVISIVSRVRVGEILIASGVVILAVMPWRIWTGAQGIEGDMPVSKGIDPGYLLDQIDRVRPSVEALSVALSDQDRWLQLLPLAALVIAACLVFGVGRRIAVFYLSSFALVWAGMVWSYWISPHPLDWHLSTSVNRVVAALMFICLAAVLHLSGLLLSRLGRGTRRDGEAERPVSALVSTPND